MPSKPPANAMLDAGAKRVVPLNVSGAWHSVLMEPAVEPLRAVVEASAFALPAFDVISNVDGRPYRDVGTIKANLIRSVVDEVRWHDTAERILTYQPDLVVEFGASGVLSALMKRLPSAPPTIVVSDYMPASSDCAARSKAPRKQTYEPVAGRRRWSPEEVVESVARSRSSSLKQGADVALIGRDLDALAESAAALRERASRSGRRTLRRRRCGPSDGRADRRRRAGTLRADRLRGGRCRSIGRCAPAAP